MPIDIRPATIYDLEFIISCMLALDESMAALDPRLAKHQTPKYYTKRNNWAKGIILGRVPSATFYIIDGKGFAEVRVNTDNSEIYLSNLLILPAYRGMGLGSAFIQWLLNYRNLHYPTFSINLNCLNKNLAAQSLYESQGFTPMKKDSWAISYRNVPAMPTELKNFACIAKHYFDNVASIRNRI